MSDRPTVSEEIARYLATGDADPMGFAWPGNNVLENARLARRDLRGALVAEVRRRATDRPVPWAVANIDTVALTRSKIEPMVRGLFPRKEHDTLLSLLADSVLFLAPATIEQILLDVSFATTAWNLANLYLGSIGAELLGPDAPRIVGLSAGTTCYVSLNYLDHDRPFADFLVHEVAHVFHNCKRRTAGLPFTARREWLLDIGFQQRETFAYACEAWSWILERARKPAERVELAERYGREFQVPDDRVDTAEVADILLQASGRRNGWKVILARCAPTKGR